MPTLQSIAAAEPDRIGATVAQLCAALDRDGACIALDLLSTAQCDALLRDFSPHLARQAAGVDELGYRDGFHGTHTKRLHGLFSCSPLMAEVLTHPLLEQLSQSVIVERGVARDVRLSNAELMVLEPGQQPQAFHRDDASWARAARLESQDVLISANIALTDFTARNGATVVVPGSQRWPEFRPIEAHETCQAIMPRGSALLYLGSAIHAGGANDCNSARAGLYLGYVASWLRPLENQLVTNDPHDVLALPPRARELLDASPAGFTVYA
ncbi:MAG: phytanoyl-CoA dioxygenase family protein [Pseudomonadota bacterium]